jgi:glycine/D-amino acid oxidase-like deaminating enzyme/nitrite reductase/ring-hydroxylating ferredoxin subunit
MDMQSVWQGHSQATDFPPLDHEISADVAIVGGGITGITSALALSRAGKRVALVEAHEIGSSATGGSTGNLYATVDEHLYRIKEKWNADTVKTVVQSRQAAIETIAKCVDEYGIDCQFFPRAWHLYATAGGEQQGIVEKEYEAAREAGLEASLVDELPLPLKVTKAVRIEHQAQINPLAYVRGIARGIAGSLFEHSPATSIDANHGIVHTEHGQIKADAIVLATHTPKGIYTVQTAMPPGREYGLAAHLNGENYPEGIFWSAGQPKHSIRSYTANGERYLLVIGSKHPTGKESHTVQCYEKLEDFAREHFDIASIPFRWSAQNYQSGDLLPYIGQSPSASNVYIATGYATDGLVYGTLAASMIADEITGQANRWRDIYKPSRFTPGKSAKRFVEQSVDVAAELGKKILGTDAESRFSTVQPGEGKLIDSGGRKFAVYRDAQGDMTVVSATCTHMGCDVHWNDAEKTWDCPCHGSRFRCDGEVIEGPALSPLARQEIG